MRQLIGLGEPRSGGRDNITDWCADQFQNRYRTDGRLHRPGRLYTAWLPSWRPGSVRASGELSTVYGRPVK